MNHGYPENPPPDAQHAISIRRRAKAMDIAAYLYVAFGSGDEPLSRYFDDATAILDIVDGKPHE